MRNGKAGEIYNVGGSNEKTNIEIAKYILSYMKKPETLMRFVKDRPGHDRRYSIDATKIQRELNWKPKYSFNEAIVFTINWYINNEKWWNNVKSIGNKEL